MLACASLIRFPVNSYCCAFARTFAFGWVRTLFAHRVLPHKKQSTLPPLPGVRSFAVRVLGPSPNYERRKTKRHLSDNPCLTARSQIDSFPPLVPLNHLSDASLTNMKLQIAQTILASGGWVVAIMTLVLGYRERRQSREEERLAQTLEYFGGGSQRRSIGIALIEGLWVSNPRHHDVIVPLIANQVVYLLLSTESVDAHNERNLVRLFRILKSIPNLRERYGLAWGDVANAIYEKQQGAKKGIPLSSVTLNIWMKTLDGGDA